MIINKIEELALDACNSNEVDLYDVAIINGAKGKIVRIYITSPNGIKMEDCSTISKAVSYELDVLDLFDTFYFLEVSSPGLERSLKKILHYEKAVGEMVKVIYYYEDDNEKIITGRLTSLTEDNITLSEVDGETTVQIAFNKIKKAKTLYDIEKKVRR